MKQDNAFITDANAMALFRALSAKSKTVEISERALALTAHLIELNPANYSVWQYRAQVLVAMTERDSSSLHLRNELEFLDEFAHQNLKNYQIWLVYLNFANM